MTHVGIYDKINLQGVIAVVEEETFWYMVEITSIILYDGDLYCGSALGIYRYNPETGESLWYPTDYEKYVENP